MFADEFVNAKEGIYKSMQGQAWNRKRCNADGLGVCDDEYDNYARINAEVEAMGDVIRYIPPTPKFDDKQAEEAGSLQTRPRRVGTLEPAFLTGAKSIDRDWNAYVRR